MLERKKKHRDNYIFWTKTEYMVKLYFPKIVKLSQDVFDGKGVYNNFWAKKNAIFW